MRAHPLILLGTLILVPFLGMGEALGKPPDGGKGFKEPPEEGRKIPKEFRENPKTPLAVPDLLLKGLRKSSEQPDANRETKILKELHRRFDLDADREEAILRAIRVGNQQPPAVQEERILRLLEGADRLPGKKGAKGEMDPKPKRGGPAGNPARMDRQVPPMVYRAGQLPRGLPDWFVELDTDRDGQIGLYEWKKSGRPLEEFFSMDRNDDGFITADELRRYLVQHPQSPAVPGRSGPSANPKAEKWAMGPKK